MDFFCKKTNELSSEELLQITDFFNEIMEKSATKEFMLGLYVNNPFGFSYHSIMTDKGKVVGLSSYVPAYFWYKNQKVVFVNGTDSMIAKPYRDFFSFYTVVKNAHKYLKENGVVLNYGYPNDKSCPVLVKGKLTKYIGKMHTYCLPYRIGGIKPKLAFLNWATIFFCRIWVFFSGLFASKKKAEFPIHKDIDTYNESRYKRFDSNYGMINENSNEFYYKIKEHEGMRTAFLIDVNPKSPQNFVHAVKYIIKHHSKEFDLILYPGTLPFAVTGMIKLPRKFEPKNFNITGNILDNTVVDSETIYDIKNWDTNLSNYDLI